MSCEILLTATFERLKNFLHDNNSSDITNETEDIKNPFSEYEVAISPLGEIIVFAKSSWLLVCWSKWDPTSHDEAKIKYSPNWHGHLSCNQGEKITSLMCLPFFSHGETSHGADWTCIVVGFSSGYVKFYTEKMQELAESIFHSEPVIGIKSLHPVLIQQRKTLKQDNHDICVLHESAICIVNGLNLSQTLLNRRNRLAKGAANRFSNDNSYAVLDFKKYNFTDQSAITDACYLGQSVASSHVFDNLVIASYRDGFYSNHRGSSSQASLIVASGSKPFVGFHYTFESGSNPVLADVALAVANKIKNSVAANLTDWFGFGSKKSDSQEKPREICHDQGERLNCRFGLCDPRRRGQSIILSPDGTFSAVSDSLGRVCLIDNAAGIALRLWKGFREAQCGFVQSDENVNPTKKREGSDLKYSRKRVLFLVIYAPRKGLIEVFCAHNGQKVAFFKVTKYGRLIYNPWGSISSSSSSSAAGTWSPSLGQVVFVSEEGVMELIVPFHCALTEENSAMSRDLYVLKKIKRLLRSDSKNSSLVAEEIEKCAEELKMDEVKCQVIDLLISNRNTAGETFKAVLKIFSRENRDEEGSRHASSANKVPAYAEIVNRLLDFHEFLGEIPENSSDADFGLDANSLVCEEEDMRMTEKELRSILKFIDEIKEIEGFNKISATKTVTFEEKCVSVTSSLKYLSSFDFDAFLNDSEEEEEEEKKGILPKGIKKTRRLRLKENLQEEYLSDLRTLLFKRILRNPGLVEEWSTRAESCRLNPLDLALSLVKYWCLEKNDGGKLSAREVVGFVGVLKTICLLNEPGTVYLECNVESPWWSSLRHCIASSPCTLRGLMAALCCRSVTIFAEQEREFAHKKGSAIRSEWETLSKDTCQWDILIAQLQDVALLNAVLNLKFDRGSDGNPRGLPEIPFEFEHQCLSSVQQKGTGRVSELVAKWLTQFGFDPSEFVCRNDIEFRMSEETESGRETNAPFLVDDFDGAKLFDRGNEENPKIPLSCLALLKRRFPYSLTASSLVGNLSWEYMAYWYKNVNDLRYLRAAERCLEIVPANAIKYGICFLSWNTYLQQKLKSLSVMVNRVGRLPKDKLCLQELGIRSEQVPEFLELLSDHLETMLNADGNEISDFFINKEALWQNSSLVPASSLMSIALNQPKISKNLVAAFLLIIKTLLLMSALNLKSPKIFDKLLDDMDPSNFLLTKNFQWVSRAQNREVAEARKQFLQKAISGAVQTVHLVECIQRPTPEVDAGDVDALPSAKFDVEEYKKRIKICFDLASVWDLPLECLRRHQICELYANGLDRLAEELISSVDEKEILGSQLLVLAGKRLKHLIEDSRNLSDGLSNLGFTLGEWFKCLDMENFKPQGETVEDIEVMTRYVIALLPDDHPEQSLAVALIESLPFSPCSPR